MSVEFLDLTRQTAVMGDEVESAVRAVLASGRFILGEQVAAFEREFSGACSAEHCIGVASGSDALALALRAGGVGADDEVIVPAFTALATVAAVASTGARPVLVDVEPAALTLDPRHLEAAVSDRTRALVPVHLYGQCADMDGVREFAEPRGLFVVEDAAQAAGATYAGRPVGSLGGAGAFSFYPTKNLGAAGDGGAVVTNDAALAERARLLRSQGATGAEAAATERSTHSRLDEIQAAILSVKLPQLDSWINRRRAIAAQYTAALGEAERDDVSPVAIVDGRGHVFHLFVVRTSRRNDVRQRLAESGIQTRVHYPYAVHQHPAYRDLARPRMLQVSERAAAEVFSVPLYPELSDAEVERVADALRLCAAQSRSRQ